jgi:hypothetical protein
LTQRTPAFTWTISANLPFPRPKLSLSGIEEVNRHPHNLFLTVLARLRVTSLSFKLALVRRPSLHVPEPS